jgi:hypothetical protein
VGQNSAADTATCHGLDGLWTESQRGRDSLHLSRPVLGPQVKRWQVRGITHPPLSSTEVKETIKLHSYSPSEPSWLALGQNLPFFLPVYIFLSIQLTVNQHCLQALSEQLDLVLETYYSLCISCTNIPFHFKQLNVFCLYTAFLNQACVLYINIHQGRYRGKKDLQ